MSLKSTLITSAILVVIGLVFIFFPGFTASFFSVLVGIGILGAGINAFFCWNELRYVGGGAISLAFGICACALALVCLLHPLAFANTLIWLTALCVVGMGVFGLFTTLGMPHMLPGARVFGVASAIVVVIFGLLGMFWPEMMVQFLGVALLVEGLSQAITTIIINHDIHKMPY